VDLGLFRERSFTVGILTELGYFSGSASFYLIFAIYVQEGYGLDPLQAGLLAMPIGAGFLGASVFASKLARRLGKQVLAIGMLIQVVGLVLMHVTVAHVGVTGSIALLTPALLIFGAGSGLVMAPLASIVLAGVTPQHAGTGSGVLSTALQVGNALGVAIIGIVFYDKLGAVATLPAFPAAFNLSVVYLTLLGVLVAVLVQFLPGRPAPAPRPARQAATDEAASRR
jgi:predicted MFS family arabinose efflux permease